FSLLGVKKHSVCNDSRHHTENLPFDRDTLIIPDIRVDDLNQEAHFILQPIFDAIWNAGGYARCENYDNAGIYK
ncbi:MAG: hypothetical protein NT023_20915, partial [Armatimonadetes bacterium]|nr:hypothetical protein [Armatimonadota bacterium]